MSWLSNITEYISKQQVKKISPYYELVKAVADGKPPKNEEFSVILETTGRTPQQVAEDVAQINDRRKKKDKVKTGEVAAKQLEKSQKELTTLIEEYDPIRQKFEEKSESLSMYIRSCQDAVNLGLTAKNELATSCKDPILLEKLEAFMQKETQLQAKIQACIAEVDRLDEYVGRTEDAAQTSDHQSENARLTELARVTRRDLDEAHVALTAAHNELRELGKVVEAFREKLVESDF